MSDQPTLRYIKAITADGFEASEFIRLYLGTLENMTGPLNKMVQFAGLIAPELAYQICDTMLDWIADSAHATTWPEPERFTAAMVPDVFAILDRAGSRLERRAAPDDKREDGQYRWIEAAVKKHMPMAALLSVHLATHALNKGYDPSNDRLVGVVFGEFRSHFIEKRLPLLPSLATSRFSLGWLLDGLRQMGPHEYSAARSDLTKAIVSQTDGPNGQQMTQWIIFSLLHTEYPARSREIRPDEYQFSADRSANEAKYDMGMILPILRSWSPGQGDPLTERAAAHLKRAYDLA